MTAIAAVLCLPLVAAGVSFKQDGATILSRKASSYNDQCSVNYPGRKRELHADFITLTIGKLPLLFMKDVCYSRILTLFEH